MKNIYLLLIFALVTSGSYAQNLGWAQGWGSSNYDYTSCIATDAVGNTCISGYFRGTMDADPGPGTQFFTATEQDIYLSKFNASGHLLWAKHLHGDSNEVVTAMTLDISGNIYITGTYQGFVDFDPGPGIVTLGNPYPGSTFICKFDPDGNLIWAKELTKARAYSIAIDANQNVYTTGHFIYDADFDPSEQEAILDAGQHIEMFICKLNASGNYVWARRTQVYGDTTYIKSNSLTLDAAGNVYATGNFQGTADFDTGTGIFEMTSTGETGGETGSVDDIFILKLDTDGNFNWALQMAGQEYEEGVAITADATGNIYTTGIFIGTVDFDPSPAVFNITSTGIGASVYICKLTTDGDLIWAKSLESNVAVLSSDIILDQHENICIAGYFSGAADFDPGPGFAFINSSGGSDAYVCKLDNDGNHLWSGNFGSSGDERGIAIACDTEDHIFTAGVFVETADFDPTIGYWGIPSNGEWDVFLLKLTDCTPSGSSQTAQACNAYTWPENMGVYNTSGTYRNILVSNTGCDSIVTLTLTIPTISNNTITRENFTLSANPNQPADAYQWINCLSNAPIPGANQADFMPEWNGSYALIITHDNCTDTSACLEIGGLGIDEASLSGISFYPNPVHDQLTIQLKDQNQQLAVEITTVNGQLVYANPTLVNGDVLSSKSWKAGVYLLSVTTDRGRSVFRLVKD